MLIETLATFIGGMWKGVVSMAEKRSASIMLPIKKLLGENSESTTDETESASLAKYESEELSTTQAEDSTPQFINSSKEISQSLNLINSSANVLKSQMENVVEQTKGKDVDPGAVMAVAGTAKSIADLIKVKADILVLQRRFEDEDIKRAVKVNVYKNLKEGDSDGVGR